MTADGFRRLALSLPDAVEGSHMGHPDFRVRERIFASLPPPRGDATPPRERGPAKRSAQGPAARPSARKRSPASVEAIGMVRLTPAQQATLVAAMPGAFAAAAGAWGARGCTYVRLREVDRATLRRAIIAAWRNTAPKRMVTELGPPDPELDSPRLR